MDEELGPFQDIWDAWEEAHEEITRKPLSHFRKATEIQFDEMEEHLAMKDRDAAGREAADIISIALNTLRWLGYTPSQVAEIARSRAENRMKGQALAILDKYEGRYGI
ncbi:hypothetical protein ABT063_31405 [Streptomyces sp. NPDC002838]|uniref:hypothetical protein n=1 Tax=Streptomyces sp. NPDC002838 TaxID=3154436 RepID=UPI00332D6B37